MPQYSLKLVAMLTAVIAAALLFWTSISRQLNRADVFRQRAFVQSEWAKGHFRAQMAHDVVSNHISRAMSRANVKALLGKPTEIIKCGGPPVAGGSQNRISEIYVYDLNFSHEGTNFILRVNFGANGNVAEALVGT